MPREEIIQKLGPDYAVEPAGPEGALDGYFYEDLGMSFALMFRFNIQMLRIFDSLRRLENHLGKQPLSHLELQRGEC